jgi:sec-independent protein translocase protein TatA
MFGLGVPEIIVIAIIILLIFGAKRLPIIGESLGKTVKEVRHAKKEISNIKKTETKKKAGENTESDPSEGQSLESDIVDTVQNKFTKQVTDKLIGQVPGIKQAKQLKDKADKIKKIVS